MRRLLVGTAAGAAISLISALAPPLYREQLRPQFHFSPAASFTNDPNGLVYYRGRYHLFYQQRVFTGATGLSCCDWGHAISTDLVHWQQRPVAINRVAASSSSPGEAIFSGSAVVDWDNTSGFGTGAEPPLVAIYTGARPGLQTQQLAFSTDGGDSWQVYGGNPVLDIQSAAFRDPKVFWFDPLKRWTMVIYSSTGTRFYTSPNLKDWTYRSTFGTGFECPDFFPLRLDGDERNMKWVLFEANGRYWVGDFDGTTFTPVPAAAAGRLDHGTNYYAAQTFSDTPGRRVLIGWISTGFVRRGIWPELPWMGAMTVAREISLRTIDGTPQIVTAPVPELAALRGRRVTLPSTVVRADTIAPVRTPTPGEALDIDITIDPGSAAQSGLRVLAGQGLYTVVGYDAGTHEVYVDRAHSGRQDGLGGNGSTGRVALPAEAKGKPLRLRVLVDRSTLEVYADGGSRVLSANVLPLVNTTLTSPARAGTRILHVRSTTGFAPGQTLRVSADANGPQPGMQSYTIADVGSGAIDTTVAAPVSIGDTNLKVDGVASFAPGRTFMVGSGRTAETFTVAGEVGTPASNPGSLFADAPAGATNIKVATVLGVTPGAWLVVDAAGNSETALVASGGVGTPGRVTTLATRVPSGAANVRVASVMGAAIGSEIVIGGGAEPVETRTIVGPVDANRRFTGTAGTEGTGITLSAALASAHDAGSSVRLPGTGITLVSPLGKSHPAGVLIRSLGTGIDVTPRARYAHAEGQPVTDSGTGLTLSIPLRRPWPAGTPVATPPAAGVEVFAVGGAARVQGTIWAMQSIWSAR